MASTLFIFQQSPYGSTLAREGLEALLAAAAFELDTQVVFMSEGVWQLLASTDAPDQKSHGKMLSALPIYGVESIYVQESSLVERGLVEANFLLPFKVIDNRQIAEIVASAKTVFNF